MHMLLGLVLSGALAVSADAPPPTVDNTPPAGFVALFNGKDLTGWKGLVESPKTRAKMTPEQLAEKQKRADQSMRDHWKVEAGTLVFDGKGQSLCTAKDYGDFEMYVDWKILANGDSGIYLRGSPQVQIWDPARHKEGSGGLFNNQKNPSRPLVCADKPVGQWNSFHIKMVGDKVSVWLNGVPVVDNVVLENYWEREKPIYPIGQIELQNHGNTLYFKNVYLRELPRPGDVKADVKPVAPPVKPEAKPEVKPEAKPAKPEVKDVKPAPKEVKPEVKQPKAEAKPEVKDVKPTPKEVKPEVKQPKAEAKPEVKSETKPEKKDPPPAAAKK